MVNLIGNLNGVGLEYDARMIAGLLEAHGIETRFLQFNEPPPMDVVTANIFFEVVSAAHMRYANYNILVPNPEWFFGPWRALLKKFDLIACKTKHAERIFRKTKTAQYIGWTSADRLDKSVPRADEFLHLAGKSPYKGTEAVVKAWQMNPSFPMLHIIRANTAAPAPAAPNITWHLGYQSEEFVREMQNRCRFHLCPSEAEGFGLYISEAQSVGAMILTTDGEPMNEFGAQMYVRPQMKKITNLSHRYICHPKQVAEGVRLLLDHVDHGAEMRLEYTLRHKRFLEGFNNTILPLCK